MGAELAVAVLCKKNLDVNIQERIFDTKVEYIYSKIARWRFGVLTGFQSCCGLLSSDSNARSATQ